MSKSDNIIHLTDSEFNESEKDRVRVTNLISKIGATTRRSVVNLSVTKNSKGEVQALITIESDKAKFSGGSLKSVSIIFE